MIRLVKLSRQMDATLNISSTPSLSLRLRADNQGGGEMHRSNCPELPVVDLDLMDQRQSE